MSRRMLQMGTAVGERVGLCTWPGLKYYVAYNVVLAIGAITLLVATIL